jgi:Xaa-Pro aminopeptidase
MSKRSRRGVGTEKARRYAQRRRQVMRAVRREHAIEALLVTGRTDIRYLCGATEGVGGLLLGRGWTVALTSRMFATVLPKQAPGCEVRVGTSTFAEAVKVLKERGYRRGLGVQGSRLSWAQFNSLRKTAGRRRLVDVGDAVDRVRAVKDEQEIRLVRRCVRIAERAFLELTAKGPAWLTSHTERRIAAELEYRMCLLGADREAFHDVSGTIVASGPNSASCHHFPGRRTPRRGEPLLFDWGAEKDGYRSDITRVVFPGEPSPRMREVFEVVRRANLAGRRAVRSGRLCATVARAGWDVVRQAGYGDLIRHGLGHGLGLDIHEPPGLGSGGSQSPRPGIARLKQGMVVTIEPGIYLDGVGGVRLEDDVVVTRDGHRRLTTLPTDLASAILIPGSALKI